MGIYRRRVVPKLIERLCDQKPMRRLRSLYVPLARGDVLEVGIGSGHNLAHYGAGVRSITGLDPSTELTTLARRRAADITAPVTMLEVSGEAIPADDKRFDTVVCTWTLCTIPNVYAALREMRRVLKPGGRLVFIEHGHAPDPAVARWQKRLDPAWKLLAGGCHLSRQADALIRDAGFEITEMDAGYQPGPRFATYMTHGLAMRPT